MLSLRGGDSCGVRRYGASRWGRKRVENEDRADKEEGTKKTGLSTKPQPPLSANSASLYQIDLSCV